MNLKKALIVIIAFTTSLYGCKCFGYDACIDAFFYFTVVDSEENILIGDSLEYSKDSIYYYNSNTQRVPPFLIDSAGIIEFVDTYPNQFTFKLNKTDSLILSYSIVRSGFRDEKQCCDRYLFLNFCVNNDTICIECSDEEVFYVKLN